MKPELTADELIALSAGAASLKLLTERLGVQDMGPADHIRTKHEVKAFIESRGGLKDAEAIVTRARARRALWQARSVTNELTQRLRETQRPGD